ncbi:hypothetical protein [Stagnihabitans tardus]|uniref:Uncharacterized protein n=1 Tax=Stagnihabitans tardus TaxID=2699202 RepID=A0AAE4Y951_9RHOB|nr:hypothetical protein [Stagnihabitans tardus]NBZ88347.1 hypothetical protein [Stagnihabitans tardus]
MTALEKYQRLECTGLWRLTPSAQLREVVVGLRETTLVFADPRTEMALSHWSLPSVERVNPGEMPAVFTPGRTDEGGPSETIELEDPDMIAALEVVHTTLIRRRPRPGRLRGGAVALGAGVAALALLIWLPDAMISYTASVLPTATRVQIGKMALADAQRLTGSPCAEPLGARAGIALAQRMAALGVGEIAVVRDGAQEVTVLPGGIVLLANGLLTSSEDPEPVLGRILAALVAAKEADPVVPLLHHAGLISTTRLLTSGVLPEGAVEGYAEAALSTRAEAPTEPLLEAFKTLGLSSTPYAKSLDPETDILPLIEGDPFQGRSPAPVISDNDWISLQGICAT